MSEPRSVRTAGPTQLGQRLELLAHRWFLRDTGPLLGLVLATVLIGIGVWMWPDYVPMMSLLLPLVVASLVLGPRHLPWFVAFVLVVLAIMVPRQPTISVRVATSVVIMFSLGFFVLLASFHRSRLGVAGVRGESMLVDLRDRILRQGGMPPLPDDWYAASEIRSAGGAAFAGDFVVAARNDSVLNVAVVDVSGKGEGAGTRALLLSGALGGLLGAVAPERFLPAANDFLLRQEWDEGFATAVHLSVDLLSGDFELRSAGHPPAAMRSAGTGRWAVMASEGPLLGLIPGAEFVAVRGRLAVGDALMLYTDGLVETPGRDIDMGIDRMLGQAEQVLRGDFVRGPARLVDKLGSQHDDRALLLVHRR